MGKATSHGAGQEHRYLKALCITHADRLTPRGITPELLTSYDSASAAMQSSHAAVTETRAVSKDKTKKEGSSKNELHTSIQKIQGGARTAFGKKSDLLELFTKEEFDHVKTTLRFQFETSKTGRGGRRYLPYAFTEHGALMLANVLNSQRAVEVSVQIVRTFVRLRELLASNKELARKLEELEKKYDEQFKIVFEAIRQLLSPPEKPKRPIGFQVEEPKVKYIAHRKRRNG